MAIPVFCCGFECGVGHFSLTSATIDTTTVRSGLRSLRCNATGTSVYAVFQGLTGLGLRHIGRFAVRFATLPNANVALVRYGSTNAGPGILFNQSDSSIYAAVGLTLGATGVAVTTGQWYYIDYDFNVATAANDFCDGKVGGVALGQATDVGSSSTSTTEVIGFFGNVTGDAYFDDLILSATAEDYPFGDGKIIGYVPNEDGTHTATTTTIVKGTTAAPTGDGNVAGATDVFNWVNARPILGGATDATRLVNQQTTGATLYAEVDFESTLESAAPRAVEVITADRQAGTQSGGFSTRLNDNGTEDVIITRSGGGVVTDRYATKQYATMVGGGDWTLERFNALKARFGYSGDAAPDQYWRGIMIEAEFAETAAAALNPRPIQMIRQAVQRAAVH